MLLSSGDQLRMLFWPSDQWLRSDDSTCDRLLRCRRPIAGQGRPIDPDTANSQLFVESRIATDHQVPYIGS